MQTMGYYGVWTAIKYVAAYPPIAPMISENLSKVSQNPQFLPHLAPRLASEVCISNRKSYQQISAHYIQRETFKSMQTKDKIGKIHY